MSDKYEIFTLFCVSLSHVGDISVVRLTYEDFKLFVNVMFDISEQLVFNYS